MSQSMAHSLSIPLNGPTNDDSDVFASLSLSTVSAVDKESDKEVEKEAYLDVYNMLNAAIPVVPGSLCDVVTRIPVPATPAMPEKPENDGDAAARAAMGFKRDYSCGSLTFGHGSPTSQLLEGDSDGKIDISMTF